jgi:hypothetical protein
VVVGLSHEEETRLHAPASHAGVCVCVCVHVPSQPNSVPIRVRVSTSVFHSGLMGEVRRDFPHLLMQHCSTSHGRMSGTSHAQKTRVLIVRGGECRPCDDGDTAGVLPSTAQLELPLHQIVHPTRPSHGAA